MGPAYKVFFRPASGLYSRPSRILAALARCGMPLSRFVELGTEGSSFPCWSQRMVKGFEVCLMFLLLMAGTSEAAAQTPSNEPRASLMETDVTKIKEALLGSWESIATEVRPSKNPDGSLKPFYLKRAFKYQPSDRFELEVVNSADPYGAVPLARIRIGGHMTWQGGPAAAPARPKERVHCL